MGSGENVNVQLVQFLKILNVGPDEWNTLRTHINYSKKGFVFSVLGKEGGGGTEKLLKRSIYVKSTLLNTNVCIDFINA